MRTRALSFAVAMVCAAPAVAGPPYLTDDPAPTEAGHWEIYAFATGEGRRSTFDADAGVDLNYGPVPGLQLTATFPLSFSHDKDQSWRGGSGDVELGTKFRFLNDEKAGFSAAIFPRVFFPTSSLTNEGKMRFLMPVWLQQDLGKTSIFGGGGYQLNPGSGNRNFWETAVAITHQFSDHVSAGTEVAWQGPDVRGATSQTRAGVGTVVRLTEHQSLLVSGGPTWADHQTNYRLYAALGLNF